MTRELVIIGGASAAQSAAIYASRAGVDVTVVADDYGGQINNTDVVENWLGAKGEQEFASKGVGYCAVCDGPLYQGEEVAVIGAGYAATEAIDYLSDIAEKIYVINRSEGYSGEEITIERIKGLDNVEHLENAEVEKFYGDNLMEGLKVNHDGEMKDIEVPGAFIEIGTKPNSDISDLVERTDSMRIKVDEDMETAEEGLFAAGDVTNRGVQQLVVSAGEGCMAGLNAAEYVKEVRE